MRSKKLKNVGSKMGSKFWVIGVDPGNTGGICAFDGRTYEVFKMPLNEEGFVCFDGVYDLLEAYPFDQSHVFLERSTGYGQGPKAAFTYGRAFSAIEIAIRVSGLPVTYVMPAKWAKEIHQGIDSRLKPKAKSELALKRLYPQVYASMPRTPRANKLFDGMVDAFLIAAYGFNALKG